MFLGLFHYYFNDDYYYYYNAIPYTVHSALELIATTIIWLLLETR